MEFFLNYSSILIIFYFLLDVTKVAGCSADFVNDVLKHVALGDESGGLKVIPVFEN